MSLQDVLEAMSRALEGLAGLPWGVHVAVAFALASGLVIWLAGERFIKPMCVLLCAMVGGVIGLLMTSSTPWGSDGSMGAYVHLGIGLGVGALMGILIHRSAMALGFGIVLGFLFPLGAAAIINAVDPTPARRTADAPPSSQYVIRLSNLYDEPIIDPLATTPPPDAAKPASNGPASKVVEKLRVKSVPENLKPAAEAVSAFWTGILDESRDGWNRWSGRDQAIIVTCMGLGLAIGVLTGLSVPKWSSIAITSLFGSAVWLTAFAWLSNAMSAPWRQALDFTPLHWLAVWGAVGVLGMLVQYSGVLPGAKKSPAPAGAAPKPALAR